MKARIAIAAVAVAATLPMAANAVVSSIYQKPLESCTTAIASTFERGEVTDTFHRRLENGRHEIYANVETREADGSKSYQRVTCETSTSGRMVLDLTADAGRWVDSGQG